MGDDEWGNMHHKFDACLLLIFSVCIYEPALWIYLTDRRPIEWKKHRGQLSVDLHQGYSWGKAFGHQTLKLNFCSNFAAKFDLKLNDSLFDQRNEYLYWITSLLQEISWPLQSISVPGSLLSIKYFLSDVRALWILHCVLGSSFSPYSL